MVHQKTEKKARKGTAKKEEKNLTTMLIMMITFYLMHAQDTLLLLNRGK